MCRGVNDELHAQATKLSQMGYHVVVPELYRGKLGVEAEEAQHLMDNLDWPAAVADVRNAAKYLRHMCVGSAPPHPSCWDCVLRLLILAVWLLHARIWIYCSRGVEKVGVLGFCMGGALSAAAAVLVEEIDASVVFYGTPSREVAKMAGSIHTLTADQRVPQH